MRKTILVLIGMIMLSASLTAQEDIPRRQKSITYEQMTEQMAKELQLDEKQQKKVAKLNKKYKTLIEGEQAERPQGQRPPMGERPSGGPSGRPSGSMGGPGGGMPGEQSQEKSYDYDKQQQKYDKTIGKILSEQQYESYLKIKPQFASQRRVREFLLGGQQALGGGMPMPPGGMGGPASRSQLSNLIH